MSEWRELAAYMCKLGILEPIELEQVFYAHGEPVLNCAFAVLKTSSDGSPPPLQRFIMNLVPSNSYQREAFSSCRHSGATYLALQAGDVLTVSSQDLKACFCLFRLPFVWKPFFTFCEPVPRSLLGLSGAGSCYVASVVVSMGWISACGVVQHLRRNMLLAPLPMGGGALNAHEV
eukprot:5300233-Amphidinium_carterae.1